MATSDLNGRCDVSPKGDAPGFVRVLNERRLAIPDRPGNKRLDGMTNLIANPHVGLIFLVPGREETLRINGRACITRDSELLRRFEVQGKTPLLALLSMSSNATCTAGRRFDAHNFGRTNSGRHPTPFRPWPVFCSISLSPTASRSSSWSTTSKRAIGHACIRRFPWRYFKLRLLAPGHYCSCCR